MPPRLRSLRLRQCRPRPPQLAPRAVSVARNHRPRSKTHRPSQASTRATTPGTASSTSSRLTVAWPDYDRDSWKITFVTSRGLNWIGPATSDASATSRTAIGARAGWLSDGAGFVRRLIKHGRVAITYPVADWVRSFEMTFTEQQRAAMRQMYDRCLKSCEGTQLPKAEA